MVDGGLGEAVGKLYVERHFPPASEGDGCWSWSATCSRPTGASIDALDWMSEETKQKAYDKLDSFNPKIGYPDECRDYSPLEITPDDLIGNVLRVGGASRPTASSTRSASPVDRGEWLMLPQHGQRLLQPGHQRDLLPGRRSCSGRSSTPTGRPRRTTAASVR